MQVLEKDMIELNKQFATKEEAIRYCGEKLLAAGCVEKNTSKPCLSVTRCSQSIWGTLLRFLTARMKPKNTSKNLVSVSCKYLMA